MFADVQHQRLLLFLLINDKRGLFKDIVDEDVIVDEQGE